MQQSNHFITAAQKVAFYLLLQLVLTCFQPQEDAKANRRIARWHRLLPGSKADCLMVLLDEWGRAVQPVAWDSWTLRSAWTREHVSSCALSTARLACLQYVFYPVRGCLLWAIAYGSHARCSAQQPGCLQFLLQGKAHVFAAFTVSAQE